MLRSLVADKATGFKTRSILTVPVLDWKGGVLGVIQVTSHAAPHPQVIDRHAVCVRARVRGQAVNKQRRGGPTITHTAFSQEDQHLLESLAVSAGIILRKARAFEAAIRAKERSRALLELVRVVSAPASAMSERGGGDKVGRAPRRPRKRATWRTWSTESPR